MPELPIDLALYGTALVPFVLAIVMLAQQLGLSDYWSDWLRAGLVTVLAALVINQEALAVAFPWFPVIATQVLTLVGIFLLMKGVWPSARSLWQRVMHGETHPQVEVQGGRRGRFW
jgi:xanthine/uracil permease